MTRLSLSRTVMREPDELKLACVKRRTSSPYLSFVVAFQLSVLNVVNLLCPRALQVNRPLYFFFLNLWEIMLSYFI